MKQSFGVTHIEKMPISKFGLSEQRNDDDSYHRWYSIMRN